MPIIMPTAFINILEKFQLRIIRFFWSFPLKIITLFLTLSQAVLNYYRYKFHKKEQKKRAH